MSENPHQRHGKAQREVLIQNRRHGWTESERERERQGVFYYFCSSLSNIFWVWGRRNRDMEVGPAPRSGVPDSGTGAGDESGMVRTYQAWKGNNIFCLRGRFIFGPDIRSVFLTLFLIVAPVVVFCVFVASRLMDDFTHNTGISIMVIIVVLTSFDLVLLLLTSGRDPGIIPRNSQPPELEGYEGSTEPGSGQTPQFHLPRTKEVMVNGIYVKIKYCDTCMLYRPPRCSHCSICNNCVEKFDHHCPWVGQCIGSRNYRFFFMFIFTTTLLCLYVHAFCWVYITRIMNGESMSIWRAMLKTPASIALLIYTFITFWFVGGLTIFHTYLISTNQSTYENFRYKYDRRENPYNKGVLKNFEEVFCSRVPPSKNKLRAKIPKEPEISSRSIGNVYSTSPTIRKHVSDIEMGWKSVTDEAARAAATDYEYSVKNDESFHRTGKYTDMSQDLSRVLPPDNSEGRSISHHRRSSWGAMKGWDVSSEAHASVEGHASVDGELKEMTGGGSNHYFTGEERRP